MPTSNLYQLNEIMLLVRLTNPERVLDIGVGFGKYGVLTREYLELWDGRAVYGDWKRRIDGIEGFESYLTPLHEYAYDNVFVGDARIIIPALQIEYDLALIVGTLEHFTYEDGVRLLRDCLAHCRNVIVSTPKVVTMRDENFGNTYEAHRFQWRSSHFRALQLPFFTVPNAETLIVYVGKDAPGIRHRFRAHRVIQLVKTYLPVLRYLRQVRR